MTLLQLEARNYSVEGPTLRIFDKAGRLNQGRWTAENPQLGGFWEMDPHPVKAEIEEVIEQDRQNGREEDIHTVVINASYALMLWLEGVLTPEMLLVAEETELSVSVTIYLAGKDRTVSIVRDEAVSYYLHTLDKDGMPIP